ncbi:MAG: tRNA uridine(34) 5-carboxymethylaminomethyl modification radical SAM/GNAT enzyme Elp3 [bacterium]|nr:tRNA uridine(34) 5-carboxymethylaminomethyl modification radical SAM/GNAT enzyme Elp3 [bacterium]
MSTPTSKNSAKITENIVSEIIAKNPTDEKTLMKINRAVTRRFDMAPLPKRIIAQHYDQMVKKGELASNQHLSRLLKVRAVRTLSGVAPITVLTKPFPCPGKCVYCPTEAGMPKSYLSNEPAAMRAKGLNFDPFQMVQRRLQALIDNGHSPEKIELLVLGGTWSSYPWDYQKWFIKRCFEGANYFEFTSRKKTIPKTKRSYTLTQAQKINEQAKYRVIGVTLETRPDWVTDKEVKRLRELGCTRVQLGAQILDDEVLDLIKRGHHIHHLATATKKLRDNCFKFDYHFMPNLPGATIEKDIKTVELAFADERFKPDQIKLYPTIVNEFAELNEWYQDGRYKPYEHEKLVDLLLKLKTIVPYYCRINRLIRDIPGESIIAGNKVTNLRQLLEIEMKKRNLVCKCIRCREVRNTPLPVSPPLIRGGGRGGVYLFIDTYQANGGTEYFISYESKKRDLLYAFVRLRIPGKNPNVLFDELKNAALIRELHTYGALQTIGTASQATQHKGLGTKLMTKAESIAKKSRNLGINKMAVIAGIGVRDYYKTKLGYKLEGTYMTKKL